MQGKHTPGPWHVQQEVDCVYIVSEDGIARAQALRATLTRTEHYANARLIATAPELLEALEHARDLLAIYMDVPAIIRDTIAGARGLNVLNAPAVAPVVAGQGDYVKTWPITKSDE